MNRETVDSSIHAISRTTWRVFLQLLWAAWWGGLCFYAVVVVPIGTDLLGSMEQGFVTQRVTQWHNALSGALLVCLCVEAFRRRSRSLGWMCTALAVILVGQIVLHARLTSMMDFSQQSVPATFYGQHAVYLWLTVVEWCLGLAIPVWMVTPDARSMTLETNHCG